MSKRKWMDSNKKMGLELEKSFQKAVITSFNNGYVSFFDEPKNGGAFLEDVKSLLRNEADDKSVQEILKNKPMS